MPTRHKTTLVSTVVLHVVDKMASDLGVAFWCRRLVPQDLERLILVELGHFKRFGVRPPGVAMERVQFHCLGVIPGHLFTELELGLLSV